MMYTAPTQNAVSFWIWIELILAVFCWAVNLHFYIELTNVRMKKWQLAIIYLPALINIALDLMVAPMVQGFVRYGSHWKHMPGNNVTYYFYIIYSASYALTGMVLVYRWGYKSHLLKVKLQARTILFVTIPLWIVFGTLDFVLTRFNFYTILPLGPMGRIVYIMGICYALARYRFLVPKKSFAAEDIINNMHDPVIVLNPVLKIINANEPFLGMFTGSKHKHFRHLHDITGVNRELLDQLKKMKNGETDRFKCRLIYRHGQECVETESHFSRITDSFGDMTGIMIVSKENKEVSHFIKTFRITERQMEIIRLSLAGLSNVDISEKLKISKKTTETHLFNIYNRLGINNRIELYNIAREFSIMHE